VLSTMAAESGALIALHVLPPGGARGSNAQVGQELLVRIHESWTGFARQCSQ
jgi:hypothetical protein